MGKDDFDTTTHRVREFELQVWNTTLIGVLYLSPLLAFSDGTRPYDEVVRPLLPGVLDCYIREGSELSNVDRVKDVHVCQIKLKHPASREGDLEIICSLEPTIGCTKVSGGLWSVSCDLRIVIAILMGSWWAVGSNVDVDFLPRQVVGGAKNHRTHVRRAVERKGQLVICAEERCGAA